jgi:hypothetical protein
MVSVTALSGTDVSSYVANNSQAMRGIATSANGTIIYVGITNISGVGVIKSTTSGSTWTVVNTTVSFTSMACSSDGTIVYGAWLGTGLFKSTDSGSTWTQVAFTDGNGLPGGSSNPEATHPAFSGYLLTNIYQIACDSTGSKLIMTTNAAASIYRSTDGGLSWAFIYATPGFNTNPFTPITVASSADGSVLYAALNPTSLGISVSKNSGVTWASINMLGLSGPFAMLSTNSYGDFVFGIDSLNKLNIFYPTHVDKEVVVLGNGNSYSAIASYNSGNNIIIAQNSYTTIVNGAIVLYSITNKYSPGQSSVPCFKDDTNILCFRDGEEVYMKVQDIRNGVLVKTLLHGYVPVNMIGTTKLYNSGDMLRGTDRLYVCSPDKYPDLTEDLVLTGTHSILEDTITEQQRQGTIEMLGRLMVTDKKYRIMAFLDERARPYTEEGVFTIWHIALDNDNYFMNYGIYANGLLVETCSKRFLKEMSGMTLV